MIIPDTSIWIEFLKSSEPIYSNIRGIIEKRQAVALSFIFGELLQGARNQREVKIISTYWDNLPKIDESSLWIEAGIYSHNKKLISKGIGLIDAALLVAALRTGYSIQTLDKKLLKHLKS